MVRQSSWRASAACALGLSLVACSLDQRELTLGSAGGEGATDSGAGATTGASSNLPDGGDGPAPGGGTSGVGVGAGGDGSSNPTALPPLVAGCADLDTDGVADCTITLIRNAAFASDVTGWDRVGDGDFEWDANNALADKPSGSARLSAEGSSDIEGSALFRASQCLSAGPGQLVIAYANARVESSVMAAVQAHAELQVSYFDAEACAGGATGYFVTPPSTATDRWVTIHAGGITPPTTKSILVMMVGVKPYRTSSLNAYFDNVMVKLKTP